MKTTTLLFAALLFTLTAFAQDAKQPKIKQNMYVNINIDIIYKDKAGNDLLDSSNATHFSANDITIYNMEKGEKVKVNKPLMDHPNNHYIYKDDATQTNHLRVYLETEVVLVQLNATTTDTIKCTIKKSKGNVHIEKVWYNGKLKWERGKDASQIITIIK